QRISAGDPSLGAFILRDQRCHADEACGYRAIDDLYMFISEVMALLQWSTEFRLPRQKAEPTLNRQTKDFWRPPPEWSPPIPHPEWPRDGRLQGIKLEQAWVRRTRSRPIRRKPVQSAVDK